MTDTLTARDRFAHLVGEPVTVTFSDGGPGETGELAEVGWDAIEVRHSGDGGEWTARYSMSGDMDTPHVVDVVPVPAQTEALF